MLKAMVDYAASGMSYAASGMGYAASGMGYAASGMGYAAAGLKYAKKLLSKGGEQDRQAVEEQVDIIIGLFNELRLKDKKQFTLQERQNFIVFDEAIKKRIQILKKSIRRDEGKVSDSSSFALLAAKRARLLFIQVHSGLYTPEDAL